MRFAYTTHAARFTGSRELLSEGVHILFWWTAALAAAALIARAVLLRLVEMPDGSDDRRYAEIDSRARQ